MISGAPGPLLFGSTEWVDLSLNGYPYTLETLGPIPKFPNPKIPRSPALLPIHHSVTAQRATWTFFSANSHNLAVCFNKDKKKTMS